MQKEAIPPLGLRMQFREKLFNWKKQMFGIDDETISTMPTCSSSTQQKVSNWLEDESFNGRRVLNKSLLSVFKQTSEGKSPTNGAVAGQSGAFERRKTGPSHHRLDPSSSNCASTREYICRVHFGRYMTPRHSLGSFLNLSYPVGDEDIEIRRSFTNPG
ncbi:hypothetical protein ACLKA6_004299 [Drosophila palustris]